MLRTKFIQIFIFPELLHIVLYNKLIVRRFLALNWIPRNNNNSSCTNMIMTDSSFVEFEHCLIQNLVNFLNTKKW